MAVRRIARPAVVALALVAGSWPPAHAAPGQLDTFFSGDGKADRRSRTAPPATRWRSTSKGRDRRGRLHAQAAKPDFALARFLPERHARHRRSARTGGSSRDLGGDRLRLRRRHPDGRQDRGGRRARHDEQQHRSPSCATCRRASSTRTSASDGIVPHRLRQAVPGRERRRDLARAGNIVVGGFTSNGIDRPVGDRAVRARRARSTRRSARTDGERST